MLKVYVDADFAGNFDKNESHLRDTARSRHGYVIMYEGVPTWKSQLQPEIALSSTESEYTGLSNPNNASPEGNENDGFSNNGSKCKNALQGI